MSDEYTLKFFREHYIEHRGVPKEEQEQIREAFMGGAHTVMLMIQNAMQSKNPDILMGVIAKDLNEFMGQKNVEAQFENSTVH